MADRVTTEFRVSDRVRIELIEELNRETNAAVRPALLVVRTRGPDGAENARAVELAVGTATRLLNTVTSLVEHCVAGGDGWELAQTLASFGIVRMVQL